MAVGLVGVDFMQYPASMQAVSMRTHAEEKIYSYEITPLLPPFNEYFYVKTDNPDPYSFRFLDKNSKYSEDAGITVLENTFADVTYENLETFRVEGGYLFKSAVTDGGTLTLQINTQTEPPELVSTYNLTTGEMEYSYDRHEIWEDTDITLNLPVLYDDVDYLIHTYATRNDFFSNMDAVQYGFSSICLYSGSYVRGTLYQENPFWAISNSPHKDQTFYIQSPYQRKENQRLFASTLYPFRYDSLGFPSVMGTVAKRLDNSATYAWDSDSHYIINVTYNGTVRSYGGAGKGEGQGISLDKISHFFQFGDTPETMTLENTLKLLNEYSAIEMEDDIPRENAITWENLCETVKNGAWIQITGIASIYGGTYQCYSYVYQKDDENDFFTSDTGYGSSLYWSGSLGYASDTWVDGRYVNAYEVYVPDATFEEHPESSIILTNTPFPVLEYSIQRTYNKETQKYDSQYVDIDIQETTKTVKYIYDKTNNIWKAESSAIASYDYDALIEMVNQGLIDEKYLKMVQLSYDDVIAMNIDRNTSKNPEKGYIYNGLVAPATVFNEGGAVLESGDISQDGIINVQDVIFLQKYLHGKQTITEKQFNIADMNHDGHLNVIDLALLKQQILKK